MERQKIEGENGFGSPVMFVLVRDREQGDVVRLAFVCAVCGETIEGDGNVLYGDTATNERPRMFPAVVVHKGRCCRVYEEAHGKNGWQPIGWVVAQLAFYAGFETAARMIENGKQDGEHAGKCEIR